MCPSEVLSSLIRMETKVAILAPALVCIRSEVTAARSVGGRGRGVRVVRAHGWKSGEGAVLQARRQAGRWRRSRGEAFP